MTILDWSQWIVDEFLSSKVNLRLSLNVEDIWQWCLSSSEDHHEIIQMVMRSLWRVTSVILHRRRSIIDEFVSLRVNWDCHWTLKLKDNDVCLRLKITTQSVRLLSEGCDLVVVELHLWWSCTGADTLAMNFFFEGQPESVTEHWGYIYYPYRNESCFSSSENHHEMSQNIMRSLWIWSVAECALRWWISCL